MVYQHHLWEQCHVALHDMENNLNTLVSNKIPIKFKGFYKASLISFYLLNDKVAHDNDGSIEF